LFFTRKCLNNSLILINDNIIQKVYERRKIIFNLLKKFDGELNRTKFFKLLFLICNKQTEPAFNFVPYQFGCYSFLAEKDISVLKKYGYLESSNKIKIKKLPDKIEISENTLTDIKNIYDNFGNFSSSELISYVYTNFPYFAKNSRIKEKFLSSDVLNGLSIKNDERIIYSIGYEGKDIDQYLNTLIKHNITLLCDVRKNPISMKFGFSKRQLKDYCEKFDIDYIHLPEFGIESKKRKNLNTIDDYEKLFSCYKKEVLPLSTQNIENLINVITTHQKIAFTCFEADPNMCHRTHLLDYLFENNNIGYKLIHQ